MENGKGDNNDSSNQEQNPNTNAMTNNNDNSNNNHEEGNAAGGGGSRRRTPFTDLSQVDADLALARTLQEQVFEDRAGLFNYVIVVMFVCLSW